MMNRIFAFSLVATFTIVALLSFSGAANTGIENITLSQYSMNAMPGQNLAVNFSAKVVSGYSTSGTTFWVYNSARLASVDNISIILSPTYANPPATGVMHILIGHTAAPGTYSISLRGNSSNMQINPAGFVLYIPSSTSVSSTVSTTSVLTSSTSTAPSVSSVTVSSATTSAKQTTIATTATTSAKQTTTKAQSTATNGWINAYELLALVVIIAIIAFFVGRSMGGGSKKTEHQTHSK